MLFVVLVILFVLLVLFMFVIFMLFVVLVILFVLLVLFLIQFLEDHLPTHVPVVLHEIHTRRRFCIEVFGHAMLVFVIMDERLEQGLDSLRRILDQRKSRGLLAVTST